MTHERSGWGVARRSSQEARLFEGKGGEGRDASIPGFLQEKHHYLRATRVATRAAARKGKAPSNAEDREGEGESEGE